MTARIPVLPTCRPARRASRPLWPVLAALLVLPTTAHVLADEIEDLQRQAIATGRCEAVHWGPKPHSYSSWTTHSNRLVPVYAYGTKGGGEGIDLTSYTGANSVYRDRQALQRLYLGDAAASLHDDAPYMDQTDVFRVQRAALNAGRKYIFLVVFDGMDWQTTRAASIWNLQRVAYDEGRGVGTHFQDYQADGTSQYAWMVTSPCRDGAQVDVDQQRVKNPGRGLAGGYNPRIAGLSPWSQPTDDQYLLAASRDETERHAYTDSASSATSMYSGVKTYNGAIGLDHAGRPAPSIAHLAQQRGWQVGAVTNVPISHATPAAAYAHNVSRGDYQDMSRDLLGLPSVSHPNQPLPGLDVLVGAGYGEDIQEDDSQGANFVPGNRYLAKRNLDALDVDRGGRYVVAQRTAGVPGATVLAEAAERAARQRGRLFGYFGVYNRADKDSGHLPYASADGDYHPAPGLDGKPIEYSDADLLENPTLAHMTDAALTVLSASGEPFWLTVEAGDVDWANHSNNLDAAIGAVNSGDEAVRVITRWVEQHSNWNESLLIVTADHGHYLVLDDPERLIRRNAATEVSATSTTDAAKSQPAPAAGN